MAGKGNRMKEPIEKEESVLEDELVVEKPTRKVKQRKEKAAADEPHAVQKILANERTHKIAGLFLLLVSVYAFIAFTSYFFTWKNDQSLVTGSWFDLIRFSDKQVENWLGKIGAILSHQFIYTWFGLAAYAFVLLSFLTGFKILFQASLLPIKKTFRYSLFCLLFFPPALSFLFNSKPDLLFLGGGIGYQINMWLSLSIGKVGTGFLLGFTGLSFLVVVYNFSFKLPSLHKKTVSEEDALIDAPIENTG
jgi:DNA segregation ATPase FtsK/SpoIIIE, S-DNA-T family